MHRPMSRLRRLLWIQLAVLLVIILLISGVFGPTGTLLDFLLIVSVLAAAVVLALLIRAYRS